MESTLIRLQVDDILNALEATRHPESLPEGKIPQIGFTQESPDKSYIVEFWVVPTGEAAIVVRPPYGSYEAMAQQSYQELATHEEDGKVLEPRS